MNLSKFGQMFSSGSGIIRLMDDLGDALAKGEGVLMLGGGNPGYIPEVEEVFRQRMQRILDDRAEFQRMIGNYDAPQGESEFIDALGALLRREFGWDVSSDNIAITNGSQSAFFMLFNMFAGVFEHGQRKRILLPLAPEYIGYADQGLTDDFFEASRPRIEHIDEHMFKYHVDFNAVRVTDDIGAICVSRPTNPTGNVLTDQEVSQLGQLAALHNIPLIIDNAYGTPFPHMIFTEATPVWNEHTVVTMSLSKLGLPGVRTGIVIAHPDIIDAIAGMNAVLNLASGSIGPALTLDLVKSGDIIQLSRDVIRPYYQKKSEQAINWLSEDLADLDYYVHKPEGAMFLWIWFKGIPISSQELYERLKERGVLVVPGHHFFPGLGENWRHKHECIRVNHSQDANAVKLGLKIIADEVKKAYAT